MSLGREALIFGDQRSTAGTAVEEVPALLWSIAPHYRYSIPAPRQQDLQTSGSAMAPLRRHHLKRNFPRQRQTARRNIDFPPLSTRHNARVSAIQRDQDPFIQLLNPLHTPRFEGEKDKK